MYLMISAYDVLDKVHVRCTITDEPDAEAMETVLKRTSTIAFPEEVRKDPRSTLAWVAEEALNLAYLDPSGSDTP